MQIRNKLQQETSKIFKWRGHSDTETLLAAFEYWGISKTLKACEGMFSIALWNRKERLLTLARDRFGEKPLYYGWSNGAFIFGSELKALKVFPGFDSTLNKTALSLLFRYAYVPAPHSIYENIYKLPQGSFVVFTAKKNGSRKLNIKQENDIKYYWSLEQEVRQAQTNIFKGSFEQAVTQTEAMLSQSVQMQMLSDVPIGSFLSGGIDSSLVTALITSGPVINI